MTPELEAALRRVRGLLDKAEASTFEEEQEALIAKAGELMSKYRITRAMVADAKPAEQEKIITRQIKIGAGPYVRGRLSLVDHIARVYGCRTVTWAGWDGRMVEIHGHESDVETVELLYTSLLVQVTSSMKRSPVPAGQHGTKYRRAFIMGFASRIAERLREVGRAAEQEAEEQSVPGTSSVALVLADRSHRVDDHLTRRYGKLGSLSPAASLSSHEGRAAGQTAADRADINQTKVNSTKELR